MPYPVLPPDLQDKVDLVELTYQPAIRAGRYAAALAAYKNLYSLLLSEQPDGQRFHKGYPLHNIGIILYLLGKPEEALNYFIKAYIEDLLSEDSADGADQTPAGRTLRQAYKMKPEFLAELKNSVRNKKRQGSIILDPAQIINEVFGIRSRPIKIDTIAEATPEPPVKKKRDHGDFAKKWEKRVFVGGCYKEIAIINKIRAHVASLGYEPIVASDFDTPEELVHHHSLMLLHSCKYAIFDLSQESGQLMEIERARDYQVQTLAVYQAFPGQPPKITEMVNSLLKYEGIKLKSYSNSDRELLEHIRSSLLENE